MNIQRIVKWLARVACVVTTTTAPATVALANDEPWLKHLSAAQAAVQRDDPAAAAASYTEALSVASAASHVNDPRLAAVHYGLARARRGLHDYPAAEAAFRRALAIVETTPVDGVTLTDTLDGLADVLRMQGRYRDAEAAYKRSLTITEEALGATHPKVAYALTHHLASLYRVQARFEETEAAYTRALAILEKSVAPDDSRLGLSRIDLAEWHYERNRYEVAEPLYRRGIPIVQRLLEPGHPRLLELMQDHGRVLQMLGRYGEAEALYKAVLALAEKHHGKDHLLVAAALNNLAGVYTVQGHEAEAQAARERAAQVTDLPFRTYPYGPGIALRGTPLLKAPPLVLPSSTGVAAVAPPMPQRVVTAPQPPLVFPPTVRDRKSTRLNSSHVSESRMPSSA